MAVRLAVNQMVAGSSPAPGADIEEPMWCEIIARKVKVKKLLIHLPFFELRPVKEMGVFKDRIEVID